jgi:ABC-type multidrug transport system fused ATPase/permease subunit
MTIPFAAEDVLGDALLTVLEIFFLVIWIWILITIFADLFRDHQLSGWAKAAWVFFLIFVPFITALIYLIARGQGMRDRAIAQQTEIKKASDQYIKQVAGTSPVDELHKLSDLKEKGAISAEEYEKLKAQIVT